MPEINADKLSEVLERVVSLARETGLYLIEQQDKLQSEDVDAKSLNSLVTYVDKTAEKKLVEGLSNILPESTFLTEEETVSQEQSDLRWIIDPLDGTTNYIHGMPQFTISLALEYKGELVLGVIEDPKLKETFHAYKGGGARLNENTITVSHTYLLKNSLLATGFPYYEFGKMEDYLELLKYYMRNTRGIRRMGSAALDMAYVAFGRFDAFYEYGLNAWDVAAGAVIVREAGGTVTDWKNAPEFISERTMVASNGHLHQAMIDTIAKFFQ